MAVQVPRPRIQEKKKMVRASKHEAAGSSSSYAFNIWKRPVGKGKLHKR